MNNLSMTGLVRRTQALEAEVARLEREANTDQLTGLANRRYLERRGEARGGWYVLADLNSFKRAQDSHPAGHAHGDAILMEFASMLVRLSPDGAVAARVGGDEFVINTRSAKEAKEVSRAIRDWVSTEDDRVTACSGVGMTLEQADAVMYSEKKHARRIA